MSLRHTLKVRRRERRKSERLIMPLKIQYKWLSKKGILQEIFTQDISGGGMRIRVTTPFVKGERLKTQLYFPTETKPIQVTNEVMWSKKKKIGKAVYFDVGIKHMKVAPRDRERFIFLFCEMMINWFIMGQKSIIAT